LEHSLVYRDPFDGGLLKRESGGLRNSSTDFLYPFRDGIPVFAMPSAVDGPNTRYQRLYDRFAPLYDFSTRLYAWLKSGAEETRRRVYLQPLELPPAARFLEVSVGTGANWAYLNPDLQFHGLDLSWGMLTRCRRRVCRLRLNAELCQGLAEHLPYPESYFDCVFHMGGINFFTDPAAALREMVRVALPGTRLVEAPVDLLPPRMEEVRLETVWAGDLYVLSFRKPRPV
jgi:ubiquinone/menaquinone biosynthesis C-methylase UbiE